MQRRRTIFNFTKLLELKIRSSEEEFDSDITIKQIHVNIQKKSIVQYKLIETINKISPGNAQ
ncbi:9145_t:CDS:2 [Entrophospora sp. SA101]|nr:9145_t:CDS:2 [Entrophospora sp. SA101]